MIDTKIDREDLELKKRDIQRIVNEKLIDV